MKNLWKGIADFFKRNKHFLILCYFIIYMPWFSFIEKHVTTRFHVIHTPIDDWIPFNEYFVIPYIIWFAYVAWGICYFGFRNKQEFYQLCIFLFTGMTLFLIISTVYPNGHHLRPTYFAHHNIFTYVCNLLYKSDTATNLFPSIHVYNSLGIHFAVARSREFRHNTVIKFISFILCIAIVLATMFLKQHSFFDVATGILLAGIMYYIVYVKELFKRKTLKEKP